ncbi:hypothetical protein [Desertivirga arenae]|uniref:hypothetical protein n=1 Tax=Desertivirga arenae TaxID=2810309 RepID=UPI001A9724E0|nr:hypothetical protein [Pedobacter sp. SYSU D00823]
MTSTKAIPNKLIHVFIPLFLFSCNSTEIKYYKVHGRIVTRIDNDEEGRNAYIYSGMLKQPGTGDSYFTAKYYPMRDGFKALVGYRKDTLVLVQTIAQFKIIGNSKLLKIEFLDNLSLERISTDTGEYKGYIEVTD